MKILKISLFSLGLLFFSCKNDDSISGPSDAEVAATEQQNLEVNSVLGATKFNKDSQVYSVESISAAEIPATTDEIVVVLPTETQTAFQQNGLELKIGGTQQFDGVYIRVKDANGNLSDEVLKVELNGNNSNRISKVKQNRFLSNGVAHNAKQPFLAKANNVNKTVVDELPSDAVEETTLNIDFEGLEPGKFCYAICVYVNNADGNGGQWVSQPGDVCVQVEAWGGNSSIAGNWELEKVEATYFTDVCIKNSDKTYTCTNEGEERKEDESWENNVEIEEEKSFCGDSDKKYISKELVKISKFELRTDGTFYMEWNGYNDTTYNDAASDENTTVCFDEPTRITYNYKFFGNWAYNNIEKELTIVWFRAEGTSSDGDDDLEIDTEGDLWIDAAKVTLNGNSMSLEEIYEEEFNNFVDRKTKYRNVDTYNFTR